MAVDFEVPQPLADGKRLAGLVALVTGAGANVELPGTGVAMASLFAAHGAKVGVVDLSDERAQRTVELIESGGGEAMKVIADITDDGECRRAVAEVVGRFGKLDIVVNNAAITGGGLADEDNAIWDAVVALNLTAVMQVSRAAVPHLIAAGGGSIINISSIAAFRGLGSGAYGAAKAGVQALTTDYAYLYGRDNIRANALAPGHLFTPMGDQGGPELREQRRRCCLMECEGNAWDVAYAALWLASPEARWITGLTIPIDGGTTASTALGLQMVEARHAARS
jgi:NAD(P)-dependent dehydrogenase (short-subunit alcohol dehydrogenase family)